LQGGQGILGSGLPSTGKHETTKKQRPNGYKTPILGERIDELRPIWNFGVKKPYGKQKKGAAPQILRFPSQQEGEGTCQGTNLPTKKPSLKVLFHGGGERKNHLTSTGRDHLIAAMKKRGQKLGKESADTPSKKLNHFYVN